MPPSKALQEEAAKWAQDNLSRPTTICDVEAAYLAAAVKYQRGGMRAGNWVNCEDRLPPNMKEVFAEDDRGVKWTVMYARTHQLEVSDFEDDLDEDDVDAHNDQLYLKEGWYENCEQSSGGYDELYYPRKIVRWLDEAAATEAINNILSGHDQLPQSIATNKIEIDTTECVEGETWEQLKAMATNESISNDAFRQEVLKLLNQKAWKSFL